jgi:hypothetical protein
MNSQNTQLPELADVEEPEDALVDDSRGKLEAVLPGHILACRWFGAKARQIQSAKIQEIIPVGDSATKAFIIMVQIHYADNGSETCVLPLAYVEGTRADRAAVKYPASVVARLRPKEQSEVGILFDAMVDTAFCDTLLDIMADDRRLKGSGGKCVCAVFTRAYLDIADSSSFLPWKRDERQMLLDIHLLEKALYVLGYELNNRPAWVKIPLRGVQQLMGTGGWV